MREKYIHFTEEQLLQDPYFIKWVKHHDTNDDAFWSEFMASNPPNLKEIESAVLKLTILLSANKIDTSSISKEQVWNSVSNSIHTSRFSLRPVLYKWIAAASVIVILTFLGIYINHTAESNKQTANKVSTELINSVAPGGNKAILTLGNGQTIVLDSAGNGMLSTQGSSTITKLADGEIAYDIAINPTTSEIIYNTISTPRGGQYNLTLSDGSKVWLNAESSLRFPASFSGNERSVELIGEGYFEVAHNEQKPFYVVVNNMSVQVLGTHFNISAYFDNSSIKTTLLEGSVKVSTNKDELILKPGQQANLSARNEEFQKVDKVDIGEVLAWKNNEFIFNETELKDAMKQLSRWYNFDIHYEGNLESTYLYGTISRSLGLAEALEIMEFSGLKFQMEKTGSTYKLTIQKPNIKSKLKKQP